MKKIPRVYVLGDARGSYRIQNVLKFLVDRPNEYRCSFNNYWSKNRLVKYFKSIFVNTFHVIFSDIVYVSILNVDLDILYELLIAFIFRKKIVVDFYVSIREKVVLDEGWFKEGGLLDKLSIILERFYFDVAKRVIFLDEHEKIRYCKGMDRNPNLNKCIVIPLCIEENFHITTSRKNGFNVCWWGSYLPLHGLDTILEAAAIVNNNDYDVNWYFFGNSDEKAIPYIEKAASLGIKEKCVFENTFTMKNGKLKEFLMENCTLALGNFGTSVKARNVMVNKVLDACAMKCPVISGNSTPYYEFFDGEKDLFLCEPTAEALAKQIEFAYDIPEDELKEHVECAYKVYLEYFSVEKFSKAFTDILEDIK